MDLRKYLVILPVQQQDLVSTNKKKIKWTYENIPYRRFHSKIFQVQIAPPPPKNNQMDLREYLNCRSNSKIS